MDSTIVQFMSCDGKIYSFDYSFLLTLPNSKLTALATHYIKKDIEVNTVNECILLEDTSKYLDDFFNVLIYKDKSTSEIINELLDKYSVKRGLEIASDETDKMMNFVFKIMETFKIKSRFEEQLKLFLIGALRLYPITKYGYVILKHNEDDGNYITTGCELHSINILANEDKFCVFVYNGGKSIAYCEIKTQMFNEWKYNFYRNTNCISGTLKCTLISIL